MSTSVFRIPVDTFIIGVRLAGLHPLALLVARCKYEMVMSRVLSKESHQIPKSIEVSRYRQQNPVTVTNTEKVTATRAAQMLNQVDVRERKSLAAKQ